MNDEKKNKAQLLKEVRTLRTRLTKRSKNDSQYKSALKESEKIFRDFYNYAPDMFVSVDVKTANITHCNQTLVSMLGHSKAEIIGRPIFNIYHPDCLDRVQKVFQQFLNTGKVQDAELQLQRKEGSIIDVSLNVSAVRDKQGKIVYSSSVLHDITERKRAEAALREREAMMKSIFRAAPTGIGVVSNRVFKHVNDRFCEMVGYSHEELLDKNARMIYPNKEEFEWVGREKYQQIKESGRGTVETKFKKKNGRIIDVLLSSAAIDPDDLSAGVTFTALDITDRKLVETRLERLNRLNEELLIPRSLEEKLKLITDKIVEIFDADFCRIWITKTGDRCDSGCFHAAVTEGPHVCRYRDRCLHLIVSSGRYTHIDGEAHRRVPFGCYKIGRVAAGDDPKFITNDVTHDPLVHDHHWAKKLDLVSFAGYRLLSTTGQPIGVLALFSKHTIASDDDTLLESIANTTARVIQTAKAEEELKRSREWFSAIFDASRDGIVVEDNEIFAYANSAFAKHFGYDSVDELIGRHVSIVQSEEDDERMLEFGRLRSSGKPAPTLYEYKGKQKNGALIDSEASVSSFDIDGKSYIITVVRDITERKRLEEQLFHSQKMEAIGRLAGGVAHDFNNLLTVILGNVEFGLQDSNPGDPVQLDLISIEKAATEASDLVRQLLTFSKSQAYKPKIVNINKIIINHMKMLKRIIGEDIALNTNLVKKLSPVWADSAQLQRILMNLSVNARDAMPKGGELIIETRNFVADDSFYNELSRTGTQPKSKNESRNYVEITIIDTGKGMDKETLERIFDPFFTTKKTGEGTGLGLAVIYGIVKQHKGLIKVDSQSGKGASFKIYLPTTSESAEQALKNERIANIQRGEETILVVEDEDDVRYVTLRILNELGYKVRTAKDGNEAFNYFKSEKGNIDLVILDVVMPDYSGPETYKRLCSMKPDLPVIYVTGYDVQSEIMQSGDVEQGNVTVLQKPYTRDALGQKVRELLDNR